MAYVYQRRYGKAGIGSTVVSVVYPVLQLPPYTIIIFTKRG